MRKSISNEVIIQISKKGYFVKRNGDVFYKGRKRALGKDKRGYYNFTVRAVIDGKDVFRRVFVHRLQAYQKYGNKLFLNGLLVRHLDGDSKNNSWINISIGTISQNQMDIPPELRKKKAIHASYKNRRFSDEEIKKINRDKLLGMSYGMLIKKYKTSKGTLSYIFNKALYNAG